MNEDRSGVTSAKIQNIYGIWRPYYAGGTASVCRCGPVEQVVGELLDSVAPGKFLQPFLGD